MAKVREQATFIIVLLDHAVSSLIAKVNQSLIHPLASTDETIDLQLLHTPVGALPQLVTSWCDIGQDEGMKLRGILQSSANVVLRDSQVPSHAQDQWYNETG